MGKLFSALDRGNYLVFDLVGERECLVAAQFCALNLIELIVLEGGFFYDLLMRLEWELARVSSI